MPVSELDRAAGRWYHAGKKLGWSKDDSQATRRRNALASRRGNSLKTARALMALANVTRDKETARKARSDALHFYAVHKHKQADRAPKRPRKSFGRVVHGHRIFEHM